MAERSERDVLHHLIDLCKDGERGVRAASDHVSDPTLKALFTELATPRTRFADAPPPHLPYERIRTVDMGYSPAQ